MNAALCAASAPVLAQLRVVTLNGANTANTSLASLGPRNPWMSNILSAIGSTVSDDPYLTGNTGIDALIATQARLPAQGPMHEPGRRILVTCHRRETWGEGLKSIAAALIEIVRDYSVRVDFVLHPNPHVAATMRQSLDSIRGISLIRPCTQSEIVRRMRDADLVLSDSGGIQEEAAALGAPLLVLREKTERPEVVATGNARLVGTSAERIVAEVRRLLGNPSELLAMARPAFPFGDGHAGPRIAEIVKKWLEARRDLGQPLR